MTDSTLLKYLQEYHWLRIMVFGMRDVTERKEIRHRMVELEIAIDARKHTLSLDSRSAGPRPAVEPLADRPRRRDTTASQGGEGGEGDDLLLDPASGER